MSDKYASPKNSVKVIRNLDAKSFMEGAEYCKLYIKNEAIVFGVSILHPGQRGEIDPGHENACEVFYVADGKVVCYIPGENIYEELNEGDLIFIPPKKPHQLFNVGDKIARIIWAQGNVK
ncbi:MAG: cupin domain-containing protein [Candidatus Bathyarchaeia archaeon]